MVKRLENLRPLEVTPKYDGEPLDRMIKRLNKLITNDGLLIKLKEKQYFQKKSVIRHKRKLYNKHIRKF